MAGARFEADGAARAKIIEEAVAPAGAKLLDGFFRTGGIALVAFEAVAAGEAAARLVQGFHFSKGGYHLIEAPAPDLDRKFRLGRTLRIGIDRKMQTGIINYRVAFGALGVATPQPCIDVAGSLLAVACGDSDRSFGGHHVAAGEDAGTTCHHVRSNHHGAIRVVDYLPDLMKKAAVGVLAEGEHNRIGAQRLKFAGRLGAAAFVDAHLLDRLIASVD